MTLNGKRAFHARFVLPLSLLSLRKNDMKGYCSLTFRLCFHSYTKKDLNPCCLTVQSLPWVSCLWSDSREYGKRNFRFTDARVRLKSVLGEYSQ